MPAFNPHQPIEDWIRSLETIESILTQTKTLLDAQQGLQSPLKPLPIDQTLEAINKKLVSAQDELLGIVMQAWKYKNGQGLVDIKKLETLMPKAASAVNNSYEAINEFILSIIPEEQAEEGLGDNLQILTTALDTCEEKTQALENHIKEMKSEPIDKTRDPGVEAAAAMRREFSLYTDRSASESSDDDDDNSAQPPPSPH